MILVTDLSTQDLALAFDAGNLPQPWTVAAVYDVNGILVSGEWDVTFEDESVTDDMITGAVAAWMAGAVVLGRAKAGKLVALAARRSLAILGWTFNGFPISLTSEVQNAIGNVVQALTYQAPGTVIDWEASPGVYFTIDLNGAKAMGTSGFLRVQACFTNSKAIAAEIVAAANISAVNAVDLESGWPA